MQHSYIPLLIVTDQGSQFVSKLIHELTNIWEKKLEHAKVKHAQTVVVVGRSVFQHNTSYHATIGCPSMLLFHGRVPMNPIDIRFNNRSLCHHGSSYDYISDLQRKMTTVFGHTKELLVKSFNKYKEHYDRNAAAAPLKSHEYCVMLSPKLSNK